SYAEAALLIRTRAKDPRLWARTVHSLGNLYSQRTLGNRTDNIEKSIRLSEAVLEVETKDAYPAEWAGALRNLGNAYLKREREDRVGNLKQAIACFSNALSVAVDPVDLKDRGKSMANLGAALSLLGAETNDQSLLARAVSAHEQAAAVFGELGLAEL